jgi:MFS superfamily sulfate permease-like transporter
MTGSYIFSQTIFSMRAGVSTRVHGFIIAGLPTLVPPAHA